MRVLTAALAGLAAAWIVVVTRIGPVVAVVDGQHGHGLHTGDVLALPLVLLTGWTLVSTRATASS